ncbi:unnamed protein product [Amoebophrya sp. A120]|nr:unnamed protein product [Amoebophrya sp. A120]|eukprot:GSA120T00004013001.1
MTPSTTMSQRTRSRVVALAALSSALRLVAGQGLPDWFPSHLKDDYMELLSSDVLAEDSCAKRLAMYKELSQVAEPQVAQIRYSILEDLGFCSLREEDYRKASANFQSALSEVETFTRVSEVSLMKMPSLQHFAPLIFERDAATSLNLKKWGDAAMMLRRVNLVKDRNFDKEMKMIAQQQGIASKEDIKKDWDRVKPRVLQQMSQQPGATGNVVKSHVARGELLANIINRIDAASGVNSYRKKAISDAKFVPGLLSPDFTFTAEDSSHFLLDDLKGLKWPSKGLEGKQTSLVSPRTGKAGECDEKVWPEFCELLKKAKYSSDVFSSVFGGVKVLGGKAGKEQNHKLEVCESNAVLGLVLSEKDFKLHFEADSGRDAKTETVAKDTPTFVNFCRPIRVERSSPVLFAQLWHPEVAPIERSTMIRATVSEKEKQNDLAKLVNKQSDYWEKTKRQWQTKHANQHSIENIDSQKKQKLQKEAEKKAEETEEMNEEERKRAVKKLEAERAEKLKIEQQKAEERKQKAEKMAAKKKQEEPWRNVKIMMKPRGDTDSDAKKVETTLQEEMNALESLKEEKRDLDRQLEFGHASELVKDINALERRVKAAEKLAKKAHKKAEKNKDKGGDSSKTTEDKKTSDEKKEKKEEDSKQESSKSQSDSSPAKKADKAEKKKEPEEEKPKVEEEKAPKKSQKEEAKDTIKDMKQQLEDYTKQKNEAIAKENYKKAKSLKKEIELLEKNIKEMETVAEKDEL